MGSLRNVAGLVGWVALSMGAGLFGSRFMPGQWYAALSKPSFNPPSWIFAPVWTLLYIMMGVAAWMVWRRRSTRPVGLALTMFLVQLVFNALWSYLFFGLHLMAAASFEIVLLFFLVLTCAVLFGRIDRTAGILLVPYALWVAFASVLTVTLWRMNG